MHTAPRTRSPSVNTRPPSITRNSATAMAGTAVSTRLVSSERSRRRRRRRVERARGGRLGSAGRRERACGLAPPGVCGPLAISPPSSPATEPPLALGELREGLLEGHAREVGPQLLAEDELRVGGLPQQVVGQAALAAGADDQVGVVHLGRIEAGAEILFAGAREALCRVHDLGAPAVVERHEQRDPRVGGGQLFGPDHLLAQPFADALAAADEAHAHALLVQLGGLAGDAPREHPHQALHLGPRARPVLGGERVHGQLLDAEVGGVAQPGLDGVGARVVTLVDRHPASPSPAPVAVGDDGDVAGALSWRSRIARRRAFPGGVHQTESISSSLALSTVSSSPMRASVSFCSSTSARCSSSDEASPSAFSSRSCCIVSRRTLRIATRPSSARLRTTLTSSRRRSSVSSGIARRTTLPSLEGFRPTSDSLIAFSIALIEALS